MFIGIQKTKDVHKVVVVSTLNPILILKSIRIYLGTEVFQQSSFFFLREEIRPSPLILF